MAINQVINGKNRLVEHPNRYKLNAVSGQANTYDFEKQPGEITEQGTPYSKLILDKIDNVLSYLTPSVEKVESGEKRFIYSNLIAYAGSHNSNVVYTSNMNTLPDGTTPILEYKIYQMYVSGWKTTWSQSNMQSFFDNTIYSNTSAIHLGNSGYILIDLTKINKSKLYIRGQGQIIQKSDDNLNWTNVGTASSGDLGIFEIESKYIKITAPSDSANLFLCYLDIETNTYQNQFTLDNNEMAIPHIITQEKTEEINKQYMTAVSCDTFTINTTPKNNLKFLYPSLIDGGLQNIEMTISTNFNGFTNSYSTGQELAVQYGSTSVGDYKFTSDYFLDILQRTNKTSNYALITSIHDSQYETYYDFDLKTIGSGNIAYYKSANAGIVVDLLGSNDGINYIIIENMPNGEHVVNFNNYRYLRIRTKGTSISAGSYFGYINISVIGNVTWTESKTIYENVPVNNSRWLIETPVGDTLTNVEEQGNFLNITYNEITNTSSLQQYESDVVMDTTTTEHITLKATGSANTSTMFAYNIFKDDDTLWRTGTKGTEYLEIGFKNKVKIKDFNINSYLTGSATTSIYLKGSNDGSNWNTLVTITPNNSLVHYDISTPDFYKYYRIECTDSTNELLIYKFFINNYEYESVVQGLNLDGVTSNTLNGVDIDTLLQPSTYYEMLYKENDNQFIAEEVRNAN